MSKNDERPMCQWAGPCFDYHNQYGLRTMQALSSTHCDDHFQAYIREPWRWKCLKRHVVPLLLAAYAADYEPDSPFYQEVRAIYERLVAPDNADGNDCHLRLFVGDLFEGHGPTSPMQWFSYKFASQQDTYDDDAYETAVNESVACAKLMAWAANQVQLYLTEKARAHDTAPISERDEPPHSRVPYDVWHDDAYFSSLSSAQDHERYEHVYVLSSHMHLSSGIKSPVGAYSLHHSRE